MKINLTDKRPKYKVGDRFICKLCSFTGRKTIITISKIERSDTTGNIRIYFNSHSDMDKDEANSYLKRVR
jgi:hypothetical protein